MRTAPSLNSGSYFLRVSGMTTPHSACLHGFGGCPETERRGARVIGQHASRGAQTHLHLVVPSSPDPSNRGCWGLFGLLAEKRGSGAAARLPNNPTGKVVSFGAGVVVFESLVARQLCVCNRGRGARHRRGGGSRFRR